MAERAQRAGADIILMVDPRTGDITQLIAAASCVPSPSVPQSDAQRSAHLEALADLEERWSVDGILRHAFAPQDVLWVNFEMLRKSVITAFRTSALPPRRRSPSRRSPLMERRVAPGIVGLDFDAAVAGPMTPWTASRRRRWSRRPATSRAIGPKGVRSNLAAGAGADDGGENIGGFYCWNSWNEQVPLHWYDRDAGPVADAAPASAVRGRPRDHTERLYVDAVMTRWGAPLQPPDLPRQKLKGRPQPRVTIAPLVLHRRGATRARRRSRRTQRCAEHDERVVVSGRVGEVGDVRDRRRGGAGMDVRRLSAMRAAVRRERACDDGRRDDEDEDRDAGADDPKRRLERDRHRAAAVTAGVPMRPRRPGLARSRSRRQGLAAEATIAARATRPPIRRQGGAGTLGACQTISHEEVAPRYPATIDPTAEEPRRSRARRRGERMDVPAP